MAQGLRVAVIGAGYFSQFHVEAWTAMKAAGTVAEVFLCDSDTARGHALGARYGVTQIYTDGARRLDEVDAGLVDIVTPPATHRALVQLAAQRGLPMVCQKALAPTLAEAVEMVETAEAAKVPLIVHENFRFSPWYREARRLLDNGTIGTPHSIAFRLRPGDGQGADAYLARQPYFQLMPRFLVFETAIHFIDTFRYLLGEVAAVTARLRRTMGEMWLRDRRACCALTAWRACGGSRTTATRPNTATTRGRTPSPAARCATSMSTSRAFCAGPVPPKTWAVTICKTFAFRMPPIAHTKPACVLRWVRCHSTRLMLRLALPPDSCRNRYSSPSSFPTEGAAHVCHRR